MDQFIGEIRLFTFNFAPTGWAMCNGQILPINQNQALFALLGTTYGGDGQVNFALPDLRSRVPMHQGQGGGLSQRDLGERAGSESVTLTVGHMPAHAHHAGGMALASTDSVGDATTPDGNIPARANDGESNYREPDTADGSMAVTGISAPSGEGQSHPNMPPYLALNYCIALQGIFPSRT